MGGRPCVSSRSASRRDHHGPGKLPPADEIQEYDRGGCKRRAAGYSHEPWLYPYECPHASVPPSARGVTPGHRVAVVYPFFTFLTL